MPSSGKINKIFVLKLQNFSNKILNNYPLFIFSDNLCLQIRKDKYFIERAVYYKYINHTHMVQVM